MHNKPGRAQGVDSHSTLTHTLPLVCKQFHRLTRNHDLYWKHALLRLEDKEPSLWVEGMKRVVFDTECDELRTEIMMRNRPPVRPRSDKRTKYADINREQEKAQSVEESKADSSNKKSDNNAESTEEEKLLQEACTAIESSLPHNQTTSSSFSGKYQRLYKSILSGHLRYQSVVFYMGSDIKLGRPYGLHLFEPRYRVLMAEVMAPYPVSARRGESIPPVLPGLFPPVRGQVMDGEMKGRLLNLLEENGDTRLVHSFPTFIHAHQSPLRRNSPATIVEVVKAEIRPDGSADVILMPLGYIRLEEIWERPGTGGLIEARGIRMGKEASERYERWSSMRGAGMGDGRGWGNMLPIP